MGITYHIDPKQRMVFVEAAGTVGCSEVRQFLEKLVGDPGFSPHYSGLVDASQVNAYTVTPTETRWLARCCPRCANGTKWALVAANGLVFGMFRMFVAYAFRSADHVSVFLNAARARAWLGLEPDGSAQVLVQLPVSLAFAK